MTHAPYLVATASLQREPSLNQEGLAALLDCARQGATVVVVALDRLSRSLVPGRHRAHCQGAARALSADQVRITRRMREAGRRCHNLWRAGGGALDALPGVVRARYPSWPAPTERRCRRTSG